MISFKGKNLEGEEVVGELITELKKMFIGKYGKHTEVDGLYEDPPVNFADLPKYWAYTKIEINPSTLRAVINDKEFTIEEVERKLYMLENGLVGEDLIDDTVGDYNR